MFCDRARSNIWFRSPDAQAWLNRNGSAASSRENPEYGPDNPRETVETVGPAEEDEGDQEWPAAARPNPSPSPELSKFEQLMALRVETQRLAAAPRGRCGSCGEALEIGSP